MGLFWGVAKISNIFVMPHIPDIYLQFIMDKQLILSPSLRSKKNESTHPLLGPQKMKNTSISAKYGSKGSRFQGQIDA